MDTRYGMTDEQYEHYQTCLAQGRPFPLPHGRSRRAALLRAAIKGGTKLMLDVAQELEIGPKSAMSMYTQWKNAGADIIRNHYTNEHHRHNYSNDPSAKPRHDRHYIFLERPERPEEIVQPIVRPKRLKPETSDLIGPGDAVRYVESGKYIGVVKRSAGSGLVEVWWPYLPRSETQCVPIERLEYMGSNASESDDDA